MLVLRSIFWCEKTLDVWKEVREITNKFSIKSKFDKMQN